MPLERMAEYKAIAARAKRGRDISIRCEFFLISLFWH